MTLDEAMAKARPAYMQAIENAIEDFRIMILDKGFDADAVEVAVIEQRAIMTADIEAQITKLYNEACTGDFDRIGATVN
jgi:hypothetical protein